MKINILRIADLLEGQAYLISFGFLSFFFLFLLNPFSLSVFN